jgi:hypothetical protein
MLSYRRVEGDLSTGSVTFAGDSSTAANFEASDWRPMMKLFAQVIAANPLVEHVYVQRTDHGNLVTTKLTKGEVDLWRRDPIRAIESLEVPPVVIDLRSERAVSSVPPLRAGEDTVAQCFGEVIYTRARAGGLECVGCGSWRRYSPAFYVCRGCGTFNLHNPHKLTRWEGVLVVDLLASTTLNRFYLPRAWNPHGKWITKDQLQEMLSQYIQDKEKVL